jgi:hypothetical protein
MCWFVRGTYISIPICEFNAIIGTLIISPLMTKVIIGRVKEKEMLTNSLLSARSELMSTHGVKSNKYSTAVVDHKLTKESLFG